MKAGHSIENRGEWIVEETQRHRQREKGDIIADLLVLEIETDAMLVEIKRLEGRIAELEREK